MAEPTGLDKELSLEAIYYSAQIPRNLEVLTVLGAVFDKIYFPGVYLPKGNFDQGELDKEIKRLEDLGPQYNDFDTQVLIGVLKLTKYASVLDGFCEFTATRDDPFAFSDKIPHPMVRSVADVLHGPPPPDFTPFFETNHNKGLPGSNEFISYPGQMH
jgi:hypothetical protein